MIALVQKSLLRYFAILSLVIWASSCSTDSDCRKTPEVKPLEKAISITRMEQVLFSSKTPESLLKTLAKTPDFQNGYLGITPNSDSALMADLVKLVNDPYIDTLNKEVAKVYPSLVTIENDLSSAIAHVKHYYPETKMPKVYSMVSGFSNDLLITDTLLVIGLDAFLGTEGKYTMPTNLVPKYIQRRMQEKNIVPSIVMALSREHVEIDDSENSMLANMIQWGKTYYFMDQMQPCMNDSIIIGWTPAEIKGVNKNLEKIWGHFVKRNLFYETNHLEVNRYIGERPNTPEIGNGCPGRIGRYLGWMIVREYAKNHPEVSFQQLMAEEDANKIFTQSRYKP